VLAGPPLAASARTTELLSEMGFDDPATPRVLPAPLAGKSAAQPWENSLGMRFIPVGNVGFSIWETRVKDFAEFVRATGHNATANVASLTAQGWMVMGNDWQKPGFPQTDLHPVTCVNWHDAAAFCQWLTGRERKAGLLKSSQRYRMPTTNEWTLAYGGLRFPWGDAWPPPSDRVANLAGTEAIGNNWPANRGTIPGYNDNVPHTAEVGHFPANALGICDLAGNVWEWGFDWTNDARVQKVFCGGAWDTPNDRYLRSAFFLPMEPARRNTTSGFRCVLEEVGGM
jgi:eukaryotic-like serine/threonine-protein kinase